MRICKHILILVLVVLCSMGVSLDTVQAQSTFSGDTISSRSNIKGPLEFKGHMQELSKKLKGVIVTLYSSPDGSHEGLTEIFKTVTPGSGQFEFKLEVNKFFVLSVEKAGYTSKMVDFDTDVTMAREQYSKVPKFEFQVDMVKDLDGLAFSGSVASVFYQIKQNKFDYELDYSKEEMEEEERLIREKEEKRRLAELAAQKKFEIEAAAQLLIEKENASAQEIIEASVKVGDGNKDKTVKGFLNVFSESDTLRERKALAMYDQLLEERKNIKASGGEINFQSIFDAANTLEEQVVKTEEEQRSEKVEQLRLEKEEAKRKMDEAVTLQQQAVEIEMKEKLAAAVKKEELRITEEKKEQRDKVYYAIFNSNGNSEIAIQNLIKTYPKSDPYSEQKAKALYTEYENTRVTGTTLSKMSFDNLFKAANEAEQQAIQAEIEKDNSKQNSRLDAFMKKVEERKMEEQTKTVSKIQAGLQDAPKDRASQIAVFKEALPKNDSYKEEKAQAMYDEYVQQQQIVEKINKGLATAPKDEASQLAVFKNALPANTPNREVVAQQMYADHIEKKQSQGGTGRLEMDFGALFRVAENAENEAKVSAKEQLVKEKREAQDQLDSRREEIRKEKTVLGQKAAEDVKDVHRAKMAEAKNKKEKDLAKAIEKGAGDRDNTVEAILKTLPETGDKELDRDRAEAVYDAYLGESKKIKQSGNIGGQVNFGVLFKAADQAELARLEKQFEQKQAEENVKHAAYTERQVEKATEIAKAQQKVAEKEAEEAEIAYEKVLHKTEVTRQERLKEEQKAEEQRVKEIAMEQARREAQENERKDEELALVQKEKKERLEREGKEAELLAFKAKTEKAKANRLAKEEADRLLAETEKAHKAAEEAIRKEEEKRIADAAKAKKAEELALAKAADAAKIAEEKRIADVAKAKKAEELALAKAAEDAKIAEQKRLDEEAKAKKAAALALVKATDEAKKLEEKRQQELAERQAAETERKSQEEYDKLISDGDLAVARKNYKKGWENYKAALVLYPNNRDAASKFETADAELQRIEKEEADKLALDDRYNKFMKDGELALSENNYDLAKRKFQQASEVKPKEQAPKQQLRNIESTETQLAEARREKQALERTYILLMQEGAIALESNNIVGARDKYEQATELKPEESEPKNKLAEVEKLEEQVLAAKVENERRQAEAAEKFRIQQEAEEARKAEIAKRKEEETAARIAALGEVDKDKEQQQLTAAEQEKIRIEKYERLKQTFNEMDLSADEQRNAFLSELAKIYPEGLTEEKVEGSNFVLLRHVINVDDVVTIYERKTWDWGGVFYFKDADIAITEAIYKLEISKY